MTSSVSHHTRHPTHAMISDKEGDALQRAGHKLHESVAVACAKTNAPEPHAKDTAARPRPGKGGYKAEAISKP